MQTAPSVLWDAVVLPDMGMKALRELPAFSEIINFLRDFHRHCKPILALGGRRVA